MHSHAERGNDQKLKNKKAPGLSTWGFFISYLVPRRRLNWAVRCPVYKGSCGGVSVRHTQGHTRPPVLGVHLA